MIAMLRCLARLAEAEFLGRSAAMPASVEQVAEAMESLAREDPAWDEFLAGQAGKIPVLAGRRRTKTQEH